ncbi:MAG: DUF5602 domain-containing protein [Gemmatimonadales bacterium]
MKRLTLTAFAGLLGIGLLVAFPHGVAAQDTGRYAEGTERFVRASVDQDEQRPDANRTAPPNAPYKKVSSLVPLPDFVPGLGTLYVDPATLPAGPFLAYDHQGNLVSSIYMIPLKDMNAQKAFIDLKVARERADHVDIVFNAGHPGVAEPHYHVTVWYVSPQRAAQLAK